MHESNAAWQRWGWREPKWWKQTISSSQAKIEFQECAYPEYRKINLCSFFFHFYFFLKEIKSTKFECVRESFCLKVFIRLGKTLECVTHKKLLEKMELKQTYVSDHLAKYGSFLLNKWHSKCFGCVNIGEQLTRDCEMWIHALMLISRHTRYQTRTNVLNLSFFTGIQWKTKCRMKWVSFFTAKYHAHRDTQTQRYVYYINFICMYPFHPKWVFELP